MSDQTPTFRSEQDGRSLEVPELLGIAQSCLSEWASLPFPYKVDGDNDSTFRVGLPLATHAFNSVQAAVELWDRLPWVAQANGRVAFEHALVAQWIYVADGGPELFMKHVSNSNLVQAQELARVLKDQPELTSLVPEAELEEFFAYAGQDQTPGKERPWNLQNMIARFDDSGLLYGAYRSLSAAVHPTTGTLAAHFDTVTYSRPRLRRIGDGGSDRHESAQGIALAALWSLNFVEKCAHTYRPPGRAGEIAIPSRVPYDLAQSDRESAG